MCSRRCSPEEAKIAGVQGRSEKLTPEALGEEEGFCMDLLSGLGSTPCSIPHLIDSPELPEEIVPLPAGIRTEVPMHLLAGANSMRRGPQAAAEAPPDEPLRLRAPGGKSEAARLESCSGGAGNRVGVLRIRAVLDEGRLTALAAHGGPPRFDSGLNQLCVSLALGEPGVEAEILGMPADCVLRVIGDRDRNSGHEPMVRALRQLPQHVRRHLPCAARDPAEIVQQPKSARYSAARAPMRIADCMRGRYLRRR